MALFQYGQYPSAWQLWAKLFNPPEGECAVESENF